MNARVQHRLQRIGQLGPLSAKVMEKSVAELVDKGRLADRHHAHVLDPPNQVRTQDAAVFQPMAVIGPRHSLQGPLVAVQTHLDPPIADRMDGDLPAVRVATPDQFVELFLRHHGQTQIVRLGISDKGLGHGGGAPDQRAVRQSLKEPTRRRYRQSR